LMPAPNNSPDARPARGAQAAPTVAITIKSRSGLIKRARRGIPGIAGSTRSSERTPGKPKRMPRRTRLRKVRRPLPSKGIADTDRCGVEVPAHDFGQFFAVAICQRVNHLL